jgi:mRNA-decapping enzyme subunit 2
MLNDAMDKCVLVKGWKASSNWGFPKGKINETEPPSSCAIREVHEETGYNIAGQIDPNDVIELSIKEQKISLFIVPGVPEDFNFQTKTRKEISQIAWFKLSDLPTWKRNKSQQPNKKFYLISPFIGPLKNFINEKRHRNGRRSGKQKKGQQSHTTTPPQTNGVQTYSQNGDLHQQPTLQHEAALTNHQGVQSGGGDDLGPELSRLFSGLTALSNKSVNGHATNGRTAEHMADATSDEPSDSSADSPVTTRPEPSRQAAVVVALAANVASHHPVSQPRSRPPALQSKPSRPTLGPSPTQGVDTQSTLRASTPAAAATTMPTSPRRPSATADISPYLSKSNALPVSAKTLQHLQLLETVADESARMAPILAARSAMASRGPAPNAVLHTNVPPGVSAPNPHELLYSSIHPGLSASAAGFHPRPLNDGPGYRYPDPFQMRSHTSQAFHRPMMHNSTGSMSMSQNHLLAVINGARAGPISPNYAPTSPQLFHQQAQPPFMNGPAPFTAPMPYIPSTSPPNGFAPHPSSIPPAPLSHPPPNPQAHLHLLGQLPTGPPMPQLRLQANTNPGIIPGMNSAPPPVHNPLLSILNGRSTQIPATGAPGHQ